MKTSKCAAFNIIIVKRRAEIAFMNRAKSHDASKNTGEEKEGLTTPSSLTGRFPASSALSKHDERRKPEKNKEAYHPLDRYVKSAVQANIAQKTIKPTVKIKVPKLSMCYAR